MITKEYEIIAKSNIFTGSKDKAGTVSPFRREHVKLKTPITFESAFDKDGRRLAIIAVLATVWESINKKDIKPSRLYKIWDEFTSKVSAASYSETKEQFFEKLCSSFDIQAVRGNELLKYLINFRILSFCRRYVMICDIL